MRSSHDGYVYLVMLGSDRRSFHLLFPNGLDRDNAPNAGSPLVLPVFSASTPEQMGEDLSALELNLSPEQMKRLNEAGTL